MRPTTVTKNHPNNKADVAASVLKACTSLRHLKQIHACIVRSILHRNASLASTLISLYASLSSSPRHTHLVFTSFANPNLSLFNHAIRAFSKTSSLCAEARSLYSQMVCLGIRPDNYTYPFVLNSCAALNDLCAGIEVHGRVVKMGFGFCVPVSNALIDMYGKCGELERARMVFDEMSERDVVSYNALLGAHARGGVDMEDASVLFEGMLGKNVISWNAMIVGYVNSGDLVSARAVFDRMPERNVVSWTTMLVGYTKSGLIDQARGLFDEMPERSLICWTALISGYSQNGRPSEALSLFRRMEKAPVKPDAFTMTAVISALAQLGRADLANWIGSYVDREGIEQNEQVLTALVDMHAKCGNMEEACGIFEKIPRKDVFSYSALITGLASHGHGVKALEIFQRMLAENIEPDGITFVGVFTACCHAGLVEDGMKEFSAGTLRYSTKSWQTLFSSVMLKLPFIKALILLIHLCLQYLLVGGGVWGEKGRAQYSKVTLMKIMLGNTKVRGSSENDPNKFTKSPMKGIAEVTNVFSMKKKTRRKNLDFKFSFEFMDLSSLRNLVSGAS
ncbi:hypothetical protein ACE6H2_017889 [Prunus campanulata]